MYDDEIDEREHHMNDNRYNNKKQKKNARIMDYEEHKQSHHDGNYGDQQRNMKS